MYKIAYTSNHTDGIEYVLETLTGDYEVVVRDAHCGNDEEKLIEQCRDADVALCVISSPLPAMFWRACQS